VLSLAPSTPSSHVAILAGDWEIRPPSAQAESVAAAQGWSDARSSSRHHALAALLHRRGRPRVLPGSLVDVTDRLSDGGHPSARPEARARSRHPPVRAHRRLHGRGRYRDARRHRQDRRQGVELRLPAARDSGERAHRHRFTFDLWNDYLDQAIDGGPTLRERIAALLAPLPPYPPADLVPCSTRSTRSAT
jgi:hypothetical protein